MEKPQNQNILRLCILAAVAVYLAYAIYFAVYGLQFSVQLATDQYVYGMVSQNSLWWQIIYYTSEGITGSIAIVTRVFAALFAVYAAYLYWRKPDAVASIRKHASRALLLEAAFFLAIIPSVVAAFLYYLQQREPVLLRPHPQPACTLRHRNPLPRNRTRRSAAAVETALKNQIRSPRPHRHQMGSLGRVRLFAGGFLVQLHDALGRQHGTLPTCGRQLTAPLSCVHTKHDQLHPHRLRITWRRGNRSLQPRTRA